MKVKIIKNNPPSPEDRGYMFVSNINEFIGQIFNVNHDYLDGELDVDFSGNGKDIRTVFPGEYEIVNYELNIDESIKEMEEYIKNISQLSKEDSIRVLFKAGTIDENGKLQPQYRGDE